MAKLKALSRAAPFFLTLALARPAWAHGIPDGWIGEVVFRCFCLFFVSFACCVGEVLLLQHDKRKRRLSPDDLERASPTPKEPHLFLAIQIIVTFVALHLVIGFLPAIFFPLFPFGYGLLRRRAWIGVAVLLTALVLCVLSLLEFLLRLLPA